MLAWHVDGPPDAPPLVLLGSIGSTVAMWEPLLVPLTEQFRVIRIDHRGHDGAPQPPAGRPVRLADLGADVLAVLDELGLDRVPMAGLSLGGMTGMWLAIHHPGRIGRLALLCTAARLEGPKWDERAAAVRAGGTAAIAQAVVARWVTPALAERDPALVAALQAMMRGVDAEGYAQCCEAIAAMDLRADLGRIAVPTLVVAGAQDLAIPPAHAQALVEGIGPGARLEVVESAAHVATVEQPARLAQLLLGHFGGGASLAAGFATRRAVLGDEHVDRAVAATTPLTADFQNFITRYAWGDVWSRPELARRERSVATLAALVTLGAEHELAMHVRAARRNGLADHEIAEVILHVALYAGLPRANRAVAIARDTLAED